VTDDLKTSAENTWCPGCGNFGIETAARKAVRTLEERGVGRERIVITAGIGCHAKIFDYLALSGVYAIHGRSMATAQGIKLANPDLKVIAFEGDGGAFGEGFTHLLFAAKRNADITVIIHDNKVYGLTTGQRSPTSERGFRGPSTPRGNTEDPLNPLAIMLEAGATFVARGFSGKTKELADTIVAAVEHDGFSFIDVLQPCFTFNNLYKRYNELVRVLEAPARTMDEALALAKEKETLPIGIIYQVKRPPYERELSGDWNPVKRHPSRETRLIAVRRALGT
jgi:2-oxoglutarate ferredoxin oxidoreductase subunit beta